LRINRPKPDQQVGRDSPWFSHAAIGGKPPPTSNALQVEYLADETRSNVGEGLPPPTSNALQVEYLADETRSNVGEGLPPPTSNALQVEYLADETRSNVGGGLPPMGPAQSIPVLQTHRFRGGKLILDRHSG